MAIEHKNIPEANLHEPKGVSVATAGRAYISNGAGSGSWKPIIDPTGVAANKIWVADGLGGVTARDTTRMGWWDYNDATTAGTPIVLTAAGTPFNLTNDGAGGSTNKTYRLPEVADIWNSGTNRFDFTGLKLGDTVEMRIDTVVTTTGVNHEVLTSIQLGIGGSPYVLNIARENYKSAGTYSNVHMFAIYMGNDNTLLNPAVIRMQSDTGTTDSVVVNGWFCIATSRGNF